ncbi:MAG: hypothetical protein M1546_07560 [Chloroflexi bacterium]|nr:hypothetical protein [Chloroflexota bacterium]
MEPGTGERALAAMLGINPPFEQLIAPGGNGYVRQIVFDLPADVQQAELLITEGWFSQPHPASPWQGEEPRQSPLLTKEGLGVVRDCIRLSCTG